MTPHFLSLLIIMLILNVAYISGNQFLALIISCVSMLLYVHQMFIKKNITFTKLEKNFILIGIVSVITLLPLSIFRLGISPIYHSVNFLAMLALAKLLIYQRLRLAAILKFNLFIFHLYILIYIALNNGSSFPLEEMIHGVSSNGITLFILVLSIHYSIVQIMTGQKISLLPALSCIYICYIGWGRTSMIVSIAYFFGVAFFLGFDYYYRLKILKSRKLSIEIEFFIFSLLFFCCFSVILLSTGLMSSIIDLLSHTKLGAGLYDSARASIIDDYINKIDLVYFFSGGSYQGTVINEYFRGNPHNTFIRSHYIFGLFYLIFTFVPLIIVLFVRARFDRKILTFILFSLFYVRSLTETIFYPTNLDVYIFIMVFLILEGYGDNVTKK